MNKILVGLNAVLLAAVAFLFFKVNSLSPVATPDTNTPTEAPAANEKPAAKAVTPVGTTPTGKIAYVNIDELNEKSVEINDLINEAKRRKTAIEGSLEGLKMQYEKKMEEYQTSAKAGILPASEMQMKEKEILAIEKDAQNKQLQMENLSMDINDKNEAFQKNVRNFLIKWNQGRFDFVFAYSETVPNMLLGNTTLDVTKEVIEQLNNEYKQSRNKK